MGRCKLSYTFSNPNTEEETIRYISKVLSETIKVKFEKTLQKKIIENTKDKKLTESF